MYVANENSALDMNASDIRALLKPPEAAELLRCNSETVRVWCRKYPHFGLKVGSRWFVTPAQLAQVAAGVPIELVR